jgi:hypothetical protein
MTNYLLILADAKHPVWNLLGTITRLLVILIFIVFISFMTNSSYDFAWDDEAGHDVLMFLLLGSWSEYQRRKMPK